MKHYFTYKVTGYVTIEEETDNYETAEALANADFSEIDCGELEYIDGEISDVM